MGPEEGKLVSPVVIDSQKTSLVGCSDEDDSSSTKERGVRLHDVDKSNGQFEDESDVRSRRFDLGCFIGFELDHDLW